MPCRLAASLAMCHRPPPPAPCRALQDPVLSALLQHTWLGALAADHGLKTMMGLPCASCPRCTPANPDGASCGLHWALHGIRAPLKLGLGAMAPWDFNPAAAWLAQYRAPGPRVVMRSRPLSAAAVSCSASASSSSRSSCAAREPFSPAAVSCSRRPCRDYP